jgi:hypothetical protein
MNKISEQELLERLKTIKSIREFYVEKFRISRDEAQFHYSLLPDLDESTWVEIGCTNPFSVVLYYGKYDDSLNSSKEKLGDIIVNKNIIYDLYTNEDLHNDERKTFHEFIEGIIYSLKSNIKSEKERIKEIEDKIKNKENRLNQLQTLLNPEKSKPVNNTPIKVKPQVKNNKLLSPCSPCVCLGAPCEQCMFGYKSAEENHRLLKDVLENNRYEGIVRSYNLYHNTNY